MIINKANTFLLIIKIDYFNLNYGNKVNKQIKLLKVGYLKKCNSTFVKHLRRYP